jgi:hypothetical protein
MYRLKKEEKVNNLILKHIITYIYKVFRDVKNFYVYWNLLYQTCI